MINEETKTLAPSNSNEENPMLDVVNRRLFLRSAGVAAATGAFILGACTDNTNGVDPVLNGAVDLGTGDVGILNYAYALEQLEAAFYTQVMSNPFSGMTAAETSILTDIRDHEIVHREFFKAALGSSAIMGLTPDFSKVDFTNRANVLLYAKIFEDTGVSAYNGAGRLLKDAANLLLAGKIVSVEARHAAIIRDLINPNSMDFAGDDIIDGSGLGLASTPSTVLRAVQPFITNKISGDNLPK